MFFTLSKKIAFVFAATSIIALSVFLVSCQKEFSGDGIDLGDTLPDLTTKIASSVAGFVTDENEVAVNGATVVFGSSTTTTDKFGYFEVRNVQVTQIAAVVTVIKPGYFKGIKTYIATTGKSAFFRIKLLPKTIAGNIDAAVGGSVTLTNGLSIGLPAGAVVNASNNTAYSGSVTVAAQWLNPTASDLYRIMPGDLRGLDSLNFIRLLTTYGMSAVELTGASGELLQIAAGKKATLNFPLPTAIAGTAPAAIPLWYFDETKGLWKQDGNAIKSGNNYVGAVSHFSYWNCDMPIDKSVEFSCNIVDQNGKPVPYASVWIEYASGGYTGAHGYTDSLGYVNGLLPANATLLLKIYTDYQCSGPVYTQSVITGAATLDLGNITVPPTNMAIISGSLENCNNAPVTDGYAIVSFGADGHYKIGVKNDGTFELSILICNNNNSISIVGVDNFNQQQGNTITYSLVSGANAVGKLTACGTSTDEFINYTVNGTNFSIASPTDSINQFFYPSNTIPTISITGYSSSNGVFKSAGITFTEAGIAVGSVQNLTSFLSTQTETDSTVSLLNPISVNITEYGTIGQFISGNFTGTVTGAPPANTPYNITCNFRVRRNQ